MVEDLQKSLIDNWVIFITVKTWDVTHFRWSNQVWLPAWAGGLPLLFARFPYLPFWIVNLTFYDQVTVGFEVGTQMINCP